MKLDHIQLAMLEGGEHQARSFFADTLGFIEEEKPEPLRGRGGCWFRNGDAIVHLGIDPNFVPQRKAHPAFLAADIGELAQRLEQGGHPAQWNEALPGRIRFYTSDPFGNRIEFMEAGQGSSEE